MDDDTIPQMKRLLPPSANDEVSLPFQSFQRTNTDNSKKLRISTLSGGCLWPC